MIPPDYQFFITGLQGHLEDIQSWIVGHFLAYIFRAG